MELSMTSLVRELRWLTNDSKNLPGGNTAKKLYIGKYSLVIEGYIKKDYTHILYMSHIENWERKTTI